MQCAPPMTARMVGIVLVWLCYLHDARAEDLNFAGRSLVPAVGDRTTATLKSISDGGELEFVVMGQNVRRLRADELVVWGAPAEPRTDRQLVLTDGGLIAVRRDPPPTIDQDHVVAISDTLGELKLPLKKLAGVLLHAPIDPQRRDRMAARIRNRAAHAEKDATAPADNADRLLLENGDELRGRIAAMSESRVEFQADLGPLTVELERISALAFNPSLRAAAKANGPRWRLGFADGSLLMAQSIRLHEGQLQVTVADTAPLTSHEEPVFLQSLGGPIQYLSDLPPASFRQIAYLDLPYAYQLDANVDGTRLRAGGRLFTKGIGMHSTSRLTWQLESAYRRFEADLAIDDQTRGQGSVVFRLFSGSREIYKSPIVRGGDAPLPISVELDDTRQLSLVVDYADRADTLDHADWCNARLIP
ncbi:MAG TPA: NPCBM/NEW2 domain-containing protein [Pirellulales bacterium]|nr:NPCBM/NEW2 domain-containing protein [Pirellulales bacterium]